MKNGKTNKIWAKYVAFGLVLAFVLFLIFLFSYTGGRDDTLVFADRLHSGAFMFEDEGGRTSFMMEGEFRILQLTDIHYGNGWLCGTKDKKALTAVKTVVEHAQPNIIIITGDIAYPIPIQTGSRNNLKQFKAFCQFIEGFEIPWTMVFGNHDAETFATNTKKEIGNYLEQLEYCFFKNNDIGISGLGNNVFNIYDKNGDINKSIFLFDSGRTINNSQMLGYEKIADDQALWYESELISMKSGDRIPQSLIFMHVPMLEYKIAWQDYLQGEKDVELLFGGVGEKRGKISCAKTKSLLFAKILELNSTKAVFCGHDHLNDFSIKYKGVQLTFAKSIDYTAYLGISNKTEQRGGTLITLQPTGSFDVQHIKLCDII